jgi:hypothetical protein
MSYQYVYLIQTREFVNSKEPVYKIGKTKQINFTRFMQYPKGSVQIFQSSCYNCDVLEKNIIKRFHAKYQNCKLIGKEYFKGNVRHMINDICELLLVEQNGEPTESFVREIFTDIICDVLDDDIVESVEPTTSQNLVINLDPRPTTSQNLVINLEPSPTISQNLVINLEPSPTISQNPVINLEPSPTISQNPVINLEPSPTISQNLVFNLKPCCIPCGYLCSSRSNLTKHFLSLKHINKIQNPDAVIVGGFKCTNCAKTYKGNTGLWAHKKKCRPPEPISPAELFPQEKDLHAEIVNLKGMIIELTRNLQPTTTINNNNHIFE